MSYLIFILCYFDIPVARTRSSINTTNMVILRNFNWLTKSAFYSVQKLRKCFSFVKTSFILLYLRVLANYVYEAGAVTPISEIIQHAEFPCASPQLRVTFVAMARSLS